MVKKEPSESVSVAFKLIKFMVINEPDSSNNCQDGDQQESDTIFPGSQIWLFYIRLTEECNFLTLTGANIQLQALEKMNK